MTTVLKSLDEDIGGPLNPLESDLDGWQWVGLTNLYAKHGDGMIDYIESALPTSVTGTPGDRATGLGDAEKSFDGASSNRYNFPNGVFIDDAPQTIVAEVFLDSFENSFPYVFSMESSIGLQPFLLFASNSGLYQDYSFGDRSGELKAAVPSGIAKTGERHYIVIAFNGVDQHAAASYNFWLNGQSCVIAGGSAFGSRTNITYIGGSSEANLTWHGGIRQVRKYDVEWNEAQAKEFYRLRGNFELDDAISFVPEAGGTTEFADSSVTGIATATLSGTRERSASSSVSGAATATNAANRERTASAAASGVATAAVSATTSGTAASSVTGTATATAIANRVRGTQATATGVATAAAILDRLRTFASTVVGVASATMGASVTRSATSSVTGVASASMAATKVGDGANSAVTGVATATMNAAAVRNAAASGSGVATATILTSIPGGAESASGSGTGVASATLIALRLRNLSASVQGLATASAQAKVIRGASSAVTGVATASVLATKPGETLRWAIDTTIKTLTPVTRIEQT